MLYHCRLRGLVHDGERDVYIHPLNNPTLKRSSVYRQWSVAKIIAEVAHVGIRRLEEIVRLEIWESITNAFSLLC